MMILLDISTSYRFRHLNPMGILRVEHEVVRALTQAYGDKVVLGVYDEARSGFYRMSLDEFTAVAIDKTWAATMPERTLTAPSRWRSWARIGRFWLRSRRRCRAVPGAGDLVHRLHEEIIADELMWLSLDEYTMMRGVLDRAQHVFPKYTQRIVSLDSINHRAHHGLIDAPEARLTYPDNRISDDMIRHYISVGGFWSDTRHRGAYERRRDCGWTVHYLFHDLIPVLWAHVAEPTTRKTFPLALHWVLWGLDQCWTNSQTTRNDLLDHIDSYGYPPMDPDWVTPVYLGSEVPASDLTPDQEKAILRRFGLEDGRFVLMVGTQEVRKNHDLAYRLWREMNQRHPGQVMPLVWAGQPGWNIDPLLDMVQRDNGLPVDAIRILSSVSDAELAALYKACRYTIYPSHYEGWGLPVVESLSYGKPCLTSDAPSLIEAGAGASEAIGLLDGEAWLARCFALMTDAAAYDAACARAAAFTPYDWPGFRRALVSDFQRFLDDRTAKDASQ